MRIYDPRVGRFLSTDPLTKNYPWYTPYQFAGNKPIWATDLDGMEERLSTTAFKAIFGSPSSHANPRTPLSVMTNARLKGQVEFANSRAGQFIGGAWNLATGTVGTIASISYINGSGGTGAALGGTLALQFSLGEMAIGTSQMIDAAFSPKTNSALQSSGSIPGLIAYSSGSQYAPFIDALGQFAPSISTATSLKGLLKSGFGAFDAAKDYAKAPSVKSVVGMLDQFSDSYGIIMESFKLTNQMNGSSIKQSFNYLFSYTVQKGETLSEIAAKFGRSLDAVTKENRISNPDKIQAGQKLKFSGFVEGSTGGGGAGSNY